jgi:hypothetical protein
LRIGRYNRMKTARLPFRAFSTGCLVGAVSGEVFTRTPFGDLKPPGMGRDKSRHALDTYIELKTVWIGFS